MPKLLGIAGGSGTGKSTLSISLVQKYPTIFGLVHLDDYFKSREDVVMSHSQEDFSPYKV